MGLMYESEHKKLHFLIPSIFMSYFLCNKKGTKTHSI
jgi:hypothetical protein